MKLQKRNRQNQNLKKGSKKPERKQSSLTTAISNRADELANTISINGRVTDNASPWLRKSVFHGIDGRTWRGRRLNEHYISIINDLGGDDMVSHMEKMLVKQAAILGVMAEEFALLYHETDDDYDYLEHITCIKVQITLLKTLGLKRRSKPVEIPDLKTYAKRKKKEEEIIDVDPIEED